MKDSADLHGFPVLAVRDNHIVYCIVLNVDPVIGILSPTKRMIWLK